MAFKNNYVKRDDSIEASFFSFLQPKEEKQRVFFDDFYAQYDSWRAYYVRYGTRIYDHTVVKNYLMSPDCETVDEVLGFANVRRAYTAILRRNADVMWKNRAFGVIRKIIETAYKWQFITLQEKEQSTSILDNLPENRKKRVQRRILTTEQTRKFFSVIEDPDDRLYFLVALTLGARISEVTGLTWDCFDEYGGYIEIKQQLYLTNTALQESATVLQSSLPSEMTCAHYLLRRFPRLG